MGIQPQRYDTKHEPLRIGANPAGKELGYAAGQLGYAERTTNQTGISTEVDLTGLSVTVLVGANRRVKISGFVQFASASTSGTSLLRIKEGATVLQLSQINYNTIGGNGWYLYSSIVITPSSGSHTYKLSAQGTAGTIDLIVGVGGARAFILVEDIGAA